VPAPKEGIRARFRYGSRRFWGARGDNMGWILNSKRGRRVGRIAGERRGDWNFVLLFWGRVAAWVTEPSGRRVDARVIGLLIYTMWHTGIDGKFQDVVYTVLSAHPLHLGGGGGLRDPTVPCGGPLGRAVQFADHAGAVKTDTR
jgi:hypothetical protein